MLQVRSTGRRSESANSNSDYLDEEEQESGNRRRPNVTYAGSWVAVPGMAKVVRCGRNRLAAAVDKGRPIRLSNLTFTWRAPSSDVGELEARASVAYGGAYVSVVSRPFSYKRFPVSTSRCGRSISCFRVCGLRPRCDAAESSYMVTMEADEEREEVTIRLGGLIRDNQVYFFPYGGDNSNNICNPFFFQSYIGLGFGLDKKNLRNMDFVACTRSGEDGN